MSRPTICHVCNGSDFTLTEETDDHNVYTCMTCGEEEWEILGDYDEEFKEDLEDSCKDCTDDWAPPDCIDEW